MCGVRFVKRRLFVQAGIATLAVLAAPRLVRANGDDFFNNPLDAKIPLDQQIVFVGTAKDPAGNYLDNVSINISVNVPPGYSLEPITFNAYTNVIGRYRTLDVLSVVSSMIGADLDLPAKSVEISAKKPGYVMSRRMNRSRTSQNRGLFEVNFVLEKA